MILHSEDISYVQRIVGTCTQETPFSQYSKHIWLTYSRSGTAKRSMNAEQSHLQDLQTQPLGLLQIKAVA